MISLLLGGGQKTPDGARIGYGARISRLPSIPYWLLGAVALWFATAHCAAIYTEAINWDELALMSRAQRTIEAGELRGGGRPGLGTLLFTPLVKGCDDEIAVIHVARWMTAAATAAYLIGLFVLLRNLLSGHRERPALDAAFGVALLVCVPVFVRWSLQVRTDQWAIACGLWGGVALLASARRPALSLLAGALFGTGWLFTQKLAYVLALVLLLCAGQQWRERELRVRRDALRVTLAGLGAVLVVGGYYAITALAFTSPVASNTTTLSDSADFYRRIGYGVYHGVVRSLGAHGVLLALLMVVSLLPSTRDRRALAVPWAVLLLGVAVGYVHPSAFPYFWMTLGLFSAVAGAIALQPICALFSSRSLRAAFVGGLWLALAAVAVPARLSLATDSQAPQRRALSFVRDNFPGSARGFQPEGALFCRNDPAPFEIYMSMHIAKRLKSADDVQAFIASFVDKPVSYIVMSYRLGQFPPAVQAFWRDHYVLYGPAVLIPGFAVTSSDVDGRAINALVAGDYRWKPTPSNARVEVDGKVVVDGGVVSLAAGKHTLRAIDSIELGLLAYAVPSGPAPSTSFYGEAMLRELIHGR